MSLISRRNFIVSGGAITTLAACGNGINSGGAARIDARSDSALSFLYNNIGGSRELAQKASGILIMPLVSQAGLGIGGSYGRGALRINDAAVDYYSLVSASFGLQIGVQQYAHALFFMNDEALTDFRRGGGWEVGADAQYAAVNEGGGLRADTTTSLSPVIAFVFGQAGLIAGATIEGNKYSRILP